MKGVTGFMWGAIFGAVGAGSWFLNGDDDLREIFDGGPYRNQLTAQRGDSYDSSGVAHSLGAEADSAAGYRSGSPGSAEATPNRGLPHKSAASARPPSPSSGEVQHLGAPVSADSEDAAYMPIEGHARQIGREIRVDAPGYSFEEHWAPQRIGGDISVDPVSPREGWR